MSQDTRCWYYRGGWTCYRAGGNICYADTPTAVNREHAILDADRCVAVNPSDTAPALVALDAQMVIRGPKGERVVDAEDYWIGPGIDITRMNVLQPNELLTAIRIPSTMGGRAVLLREGARPPGVGLPAGQRRVGDRSFTAARSSEARLVVNAVAATPRRLTSGRDGDHRQAAQRRDGGHGRQDGGRRRADAAAQRLQGAADAKPGEARDSRRRRAVHGPPKVGTESVGPVGSHPRLVESVLGVAVRGRAVLRRARELHAVLGAPQAAAG